MWAAPNGGSLLPKNGSSGTVPTPKTGQNRKKPQNFRPKTQKPGTHPWETLPSPSKTAKIPTIKQCVYGFPPKPHPHTRPASV